jgi:hypothetical protein
MVNRNATRIIYRVATDTLTGRAGHFLPPFQQVTALSLRACVRELKGGGMAEKPHCAKCDAELPESERGGRPLEYCSTRCRRDAENELRRTNRQISRLQILVANLRVAIAKGDDTYFLGWGRPVNALPLAEAKLAQLQTTVLESQNG